jgi:cell division transport system ATP-binding protein
MIVLNCVSQWYVPQQKILNNVSFTLKKGDFLYIVGGSGAGKSTLLKLLSGDVKPNFGNVHLFGFPLHHAPSNTVCAIRRCIGVIPQKIQLIPELNVFDNVAMSFTISRAHFLRSEHKDRIHDLLKKMGLSHKAKVATGMLSGGEAQRVAIARALIRSPEFIVADEPTGAQDRDFTWIVMDLLLKANQSGITVILATHDRDIVRRIRKKAALLRDGMIQFEDPLCIY